MSDHISLSQTSTDEFIRPIAWKVTYRQRYLLNLFLFAGTILTTLFWGTIMMLSFENAGFSMDIFRLLSALAVHPLLLLKGIPYSFTILAILLSHEMGHYLACRYYRIRATLPFFIPAPIYTGTFGAFIRIRSPFPNRRSLFDVGIAGPLAGFFVSLPFIYLGLHWSAPVEQTAAAGQMYLGEPLIFRLLERHLALDNYLIHPAGFAAWFACLATSLNLLPIAQLDGGHISYALFGKRAYFITWTFFASLIGLAIYAFIRYGYVSGLQWLVYCGMLLILKKIAGFRHPPTLDDEFPIGWGRKLWGIFALIVFVLTFMPVTIFQ